VSLVLLIFVTGAVAYRLGRWWTVAIAPAAGLAVAGVIAATGGSLADTPLLFVIAFATLASAGGVLVRRRALTAI
jgi:hypothetical protein